MKCMMSVDGSNIVRVSDDKAVKLYHEGFRYVSKSVWKETVRNIEQPEEKKPTKNKSNKMSRAQKRHIKKSNK